MHIKLTEYVRATTLTLNIKDAPMTALPLIKDAFAKLATDLEELMPEPRGSAWNLLKETAGEVMQPVGAPVEAADEQEAHEIAEASAAINPEPKRRGRPPKAKLEEPTPVVEPTPLEQAIAKAEDLAATQPVNLKEDEQSQGEIAPSAEPLSTPTTDSATTAATPPSISDFDMNSYLAKVCNQSKGAAYKETIYELAKPFVEEGAVPRPSNIKGDDKRWQFIKAVETDSGVKYHG